MKERLLTTRDLKAVNGTDTSKFGKSVSDNAKALKEWNLSDTDFRYAFETDGVQEGEDQINALVQAALDAGVISDTSASSVANLASMLAELGVISSSTGSSLDEAADSIGDISERIDKASAALTGIQKAESVLDAQSTGKSISLDDFNSDELADYTSALEYNNGALQLNAEKVRELQKAKAEEQIQTNNSQKAEKQNQYMQNIAQIEQLQDQLRGLTDAKGEEAQAIQSSIDALLSDNDAIVNQCNQLDLLSASLREATGAYQNWLDKQNASESGDMFDDAMGAMEKIDNVTKNSDSEDYGRIGTNSYKAAVDFIVPDTVDSQDAEAVSSYMSSIEHYFNHDEDGSRIGLDVQEFCAKATKAGLMELDEASGEYKVAGQKTMEDFAEGLNLSMPMVQSMFGEMEEFGGEFDWADEATKTLGDMAVAAGEAKGRIEEMSGDTDMNIQIDVSDIENTEDKVKTLDNTISQMQNYKTTLDVDSSQVDDANAVIQYCVTQKQMLEAPAVMSVDTSQVDGELGNVLSLLQQFQEAQNSVQKQRKYKQNEVTDLQKQLNASVKSGIIKKGSEEWLEMTNQILEAQNAVSDFDTQIEQAKQDKITTVYEEMFDRAIEKANRLKDKIGSINDLITEDMMIDKDTGNLTEMGALSITMNSQQLDTELNNLQTYVKKRQQIMDDFANGSSKSKYGEKTYDELMSENDSAMQESLKNVNNYRQSIISIVTNQAKAVQDAMFKEIDARKKALKKKKEYYDYDKTIKKKTDEIELIKQQIRGLEGLTDAESKAQKARLEASLKDKQDDLDDTVRDHVYDITVNGLDDLETQLSEDFEKWSNQLSSDLAKMSDAISNTISGAGENYSDMMAGIDYILNNIGGITSGQYFTSQDKSNMKKSNSFDTGYNSGHLKGYAKGTKHVGGVPRVAMTNENGREIIVTKKGILTPVEPSDGIIPNDMTETLMKMAERQQNYAMNSNFKMPELKVKDASGNSVNNVYNTFTVQGDLTRDTLPELNKILDLASSKTQNDIRKNKRRFG